MRVVRRSQLGQFAVRNHGSIELQGRSEGSDQLGVPGRGRGLNVGRDGRGKSRQMTAEGNKSHWLGRPISEGSRIKIKCPQTRKGEGSWERNVQPPWCQLYLAPPLTGGARSRVAVSLDDWKHILHLI
jgi:hypothetical protein